MTFLEGLHGAVALILLASLLFAEEAGVPIPFAPGEVMLIIAGLLIQTGGLTDGSSSRSRSCAAVADPSPATAGPISSENMASTSPLPASTRKNAWPR